MQMLLREWGYYMFNVNILLISWLLCVRDRRHETYAFRPRNAGSNLNMINLRKASGKTFRRSALKAYQGMRWKCVAEIVLKLSIFVRVKSHRNQEFECIVIAVTQLFPGKGTNRISWKTSSKFNNFSPNTNPQKTTQDKSLKTLLYGHKK